MMPIKPIRSEADYRNALAEIERLMDIPEDRLSDPEGDQLSVLAVLVEDYERQHHPIEAADPIEAITYMMQERGLSRADLEPLIGARGRVSEVMTRKRALSIAMIRALSQRLGIPAEVLMRPYDLRPNPPGKSRCRQEQRRARGAGRQRAA